MKKFLVFICLLFSSLAYSQQSESVYVHFATDKYDLTNLTRAVLDSLTDSLDAADRIELHGHCDARGSDVYNIRLSERRVKAVEKYLLGLGWEKKDMSIVQAHGEAAPLNDNGTETARMLNRRVEIKILRGQAKPTLKQQLGDNKVKTGDNIVLRNINFYGGMHQFLPESTPMLEELYEALKTYPKLTIRIEGHICCAPDNRDGQDTETGMDNLSEARSKAVMDYLVGRGIQSNRLSFKGFGHSKPLHAYPERTEEERIENRRVEIKILTK